MRFGTRELVFVLVLLAMPVAAYFFVFQPRQMQLDEAHEEIVAKQSKLKQLEAATVSIADLGEEIDKLGEAITLFEQKLPAQREVEVILKEVWELATARDLTPRSVRTERIVPTAHYAELPIKMVIVGDFDGFYSFLLDLEKLPRITRTPEMKLRKVRNEEGKMQADVTLSIFFDSKDSPGESRPSAGGRRS
ncbi:type 4a pilus biogenesis protein PilO [Phycisphaerales bacterium AB-hyl4]|uniref:Type 4a pilus biogenesis protein PilO n=1 Tax=Natronomicrosphaera hydrolytica TaxID=3242702 RepID=A0ABV4U2A7_9BACT